MTFQAYNSTPSAAFTIEVAAASFDAIQILNIGSASSGAGAGKVTFNPFSFTKKPDIHSAEFWSRMCSGTAFQKVTMTVTNGGANAPFFMFTMGLVAVKTISFSAAEGDVSPMEVVTVEYGQAGYSVTPQNADGSLGTAVGSGWNRVTNVSILPTQIGV